jgi:hypothetical protein
MKRTGLVILALAGLICGGCSRSGLQRIVISPDGKGFVLAESGEPWRAWGVNYDHDHAGRLLEDYWEDGWASVAEDFAEMRELGANVVRVHLQFNRFMRTAAEPNESALAKLGDLLDLAERNGLYLDITGLGAYHKQDTPAWYDALDEKGRWDAQANFWRAVARRCAGSQAVFCYDLMNEPVAPSGKAKEVNWTPGKALGDKHFVQLIGLDQAGRERHQIARQWIEHLSAAIRQVDRHTLITVGLVDWSLDLPGRLRSGFMPDKIAPAVDFIAVHLYPKSGKLQEDLQTLRAFNVGKPVIVEEMFLLGCSRAELERFIADAEAQGLSQGWIGFYWGRTAEQLRADKTIAAAITAEWLDLFRRRAPRR